MRSQKTLVLVIGVLSVLLGSVWFSAIDAPGHFRLNEINQQQNGVMLTPSTADINQDLNVTWGGTYDDGAIECAIDNTGEYLYWAGGTKSFGDTDGDALIVKYTINGTQVWNRTWGGSLYDEYSGLAIDSDNDIYVTGRTKSFPVNGTEDALFMKYDADGNLLWSRIFGKAWTDWANSIAFDASGYVYVGAQTYSSASNEDMTLIKFDSDGTQIWNRTWGTGSNDDGADVVYDPNSNYLYFAGTSAMADAKLLKYNCSGDLAWERVWGGAGQDLQATCDVDSIGNIYLSGRTYSYGVNGDLFLAKFDSAGTQLWNRTWGGTGTELPTEIRVVTDNEIYVAGHQSSFGAGGQDSFVIKYDASGNKLWNITWGGISDEYVQGFCFDAKKNFYISGKTNSMGKGGYDAYLAYIPDTPLINAPATQTVYYGTSGNVITWNIYDWTTTSPTYSVYHNESLWGSAGQSWTAEDPFNTSINGLALGDHNFTLIADDGYGLTAQKMVVVTVLTHAPNIAGQSSASYEYGTTSHNITWTITDVAASGATYTIYHNESVFGTPNQAWINGQEVKCDVGGFVMGDHNVTIVAQDGYGYVSQSMTVVSVTHQPIITGESEANYVFGTTDNNLTWYIIDNITGSPTYTIYHNGSTWGASNIPWANGTNVSVVVDDLLGGYHNFSIYAEDGLGYSSWATTILTVHAAPIVECSIEVTTTFGTTNNIINFTVWDNTTSSPMFTVYKNGSIWGSPNQLYDENQNISINVDSLEVGYYNITVGVSDGFGFNSQGQVLLSVFYKLTNGIWQDILLGSQILNCAENITEYAELYIEGIATGGHLQITAFATNPISTSLEGAIAFYSIEVDAWNKFKFPVQGKFFYDPALLPEGVEADRLGVYHYANGQWVLIGGLVNINSHYITADCPSFSVYAIAPIPDTNNPFDFGMLTWLIAIAAAILVAYGCIKSRKGKGNNKGGESAFSDLDFDP